VHHVCATAGKFLLACLIVSGLAALASLGMSLSAGSIRSESPTPAEIVALRFPSADSELPVVRAKFSTASIMPVEHWEMSDRGIPASPLTIDPVWPAAVEIAEPPASAAPPQSAIPVETAKPEPSKAQPAVSASRRASAHSSNVLNDAQIASIKRRLRLTAEQEQMWPAVEAALRKIVYTKNALEPQSRTAQSTGVRTAYIDPGSSEVRQLKFAALPLIMKLNDEQRREVKMMAYVMGLESVASQF
jgi:hypothetical protein